MQLEMLGGIARDIVKGDNVVVVTDENVEKHYLARAVSSLEEAGLVADTFVVAPGEESKSGEVYLKLMNFLAQIPLTRSDALVALGGGVVGDLTGFAAATFLRGIKVIQVPTSLLAAVDSSVGGKTAINIPAGKNLVGAFHQPAYVLQDSSLLETLEPDVFKDGMAEVIKYGIIEDKVLFNILMDKTAPQTRLDEIIERCVASKRRFVEEDEFDKGVRQLLNFGHTIGHAIEILSGFEISHGFAVAKGMAKIAEISAKQGWCSQECADEIIAILNLYEYDLSIPYSNEELCRIMKADKKRKGHVIDLVVPTEVGKCRLERIDISMLESIL